MRYLNLAAFPLCTYGFGHQLLCRPCSKLSPRDTRVPVKLEEVAAVDMTNMDELLVAALQLSKAPGREREAVAAWEAVLHSSTNALTNESWSRPPLAWLLGEASDRSISNSPGARKLQEGPDSLPADVLGLGYCLFGDALSKTGRDVEALGIFLYLLDTFVDCLQIFIPTSFCFFYQRHTKPGRCFCKKHVRPRLRLK